MALVNNNITVTDNKEVIELLEKINCKLDKLLSVEDDEAEKQEIADKLDKAIADIKSTIKN